MNYPQYWASLSQADQAGYSTLRMSISAGSSSRINKNDTFENILGAIRSYAERGDESDWRRFLVCGVCWMDNAIAINTRQLRLLISKCKSSINGSLQKMGYSTNTSHAESWKNLFPKIPILRDNYKELRQWTIRYKNNQKQAQPDQPPLNQPFVQPELKCYEIPKIVYKQKPPPVMPQVIIPTTMKPYVVKEEKTPVETNVNDIGNDAESVQITANPVACPPKFRARYGKHFDFCI